MVGVRPLRTRSAKTLQYESIACFGTSVIFTSPTKRKNQKATNRLALVLREERSTAKVTTSLNSFRSSAIFSFHIRDFLRARDKAQMLWWQENRDTEDVVDQGQKEQRKTDKIQEIGQQSKTRSENINGNER
jgi:hypothetical protein